MPRADFSNLQKIVSNLPGTYATRDNSKTAPNSFLGLTATPGRAGPLSLPDEEILVPKPGCAGDVGRPKQNRQAAVRGGDKQPLAVGFMEEVSMALWEEDKSQPSGRRLASPDAQSAGVQDVVRRYVSASKVTSRIPARI